MLTRVIFALGLSLTLALVAAPASYAADAVITQAQQLMEKRDAQAAYALLKPLEAERAGDPEYDYLLGIAALDSGRATEAVFALERALAVNPNHAQARAEIARAYFALGENETSRREFEAVKGQQPPAEVTATIQKFLDAIEQVQAGTRRQLTGYIEVGAGHDTNVNSGTSNAQIAIPALAGLGLATLNPAALKQRDNFLSVAGGVYFRYPRSPTLALFAGIDGSYRFLQRQTGFEQGTIGANLGAELTQGPNKYTVALQAQELDIENAGDFRNTYGFVGQWQRQLRPTTLFSLFGQWARLEYPGQEVRNAARTVGGVALAHQFSGRFAPAVFASGYHGEERQSDGSRPDLGHRVTGLRLGGQLNINEKFNAFASASYEQRDYHGATPGFFDNRADRQKDYRVGVNYIPAKFWLVTPQLLYTENSSNVPFNAFNRTQALVTVRRDFR
jgi:tetratricopeptide (TPR) repeat protein